MTGRSTCAGVSRWTPLVALAALFFAFAVFGSSDARSAAAAGGPSPVTVSLEFDDGVADQFQADSILNAHAMHGVFFINSGRVGQSGFMSIAQLQQLAADGHEIGGHTVAHADLPTLSVPEQQRQICDDRVALLNDGFQIYDFAYPYGDYNSGTEGIVQSCGYNSARTIGGVVSPGTCNGCPWAETMPPQAYFATLTPDSIKSYNTLQDLENYVTSAEQNGGGWVQLVMHHVCSGSTCNTLSVDPATLSAFLDWLQARGTPVKTVHDVIGGSLAAGVPGPASAFNDGVLQNGDLESPASQTSSTVPDCWSVGGSGATTGTTMSTSDAHSGAWAYRIDLSSVASGADKKIFSKQDLGTCAPSATAGDVYQLSAWYKTDAQARLVAYYRTTSGGWVWWTQQAANLPVAANYTQTTWTLPSVPAGATAISVAMSIRSVGFVTVDDFALFNTANDTTPPAVQIASPADGATVTGTVPVTATASDNVAVSKVEFYADGQLFGTSTTSPYRVNWNSATATKPNLGLTAKAYDAAGNVALSQGVNVTVLQPDSTPPTVQLNTPADGAMLSGAASLTATAADDVGVSKVEFYAGATLLGTAAAAPYTISWDTTSVANGSYALTAKAYDAAGNSATSAAANVTVSNAAGNLVKNASLETATSNVPDCWQLGNSGTNSATWTWTTAAHTGSRAEQVQISSYTSGDRKLVIKQDAGTCAPTISGGNKYTVGAYYKASTSVYFFAFYRNSAGSWVYWSQSPASAAASSWTSKTWTTPAAPAGATNISFGLGITSAGSLTQDDLSLASSAPTPDTTPPTVALTAPAGGATVSGSSVSVAASASDNVGVAKVELYAGSTLIGTSTTSPYQVSWDTTAVPNGSYTLTGKAYDAAGNVGTSAGLTVTVGNADTVAPQVALTTPSDGSTVSGSTTVAASASDNVGVTKVEFYAGSTLVGTSTTSPYQVSWSTTTVPNGSYTLIATAYDAAGNSTTSNAATVTVANADTTAPQVALTSPSGGAAVSGSSVPVAATASDDVAVTKVEFYAGSTLIGTSTTSPYQVSWDTTTVANGGYTLTAKAYDAAGNAGTSAGVAVTVANADTVAPQVALTSPSDGATVSGNNVPIAATASDNVGVAKVEFYAGSTLVGTATTSPWQVGWDTTAAANGDYTLTATAYDAAGNSTSSGTRTVTVNNVDSSAPVVAITAPANGATLSGTASVTVSASDNVGVTKVEVYSGSTLIGTSTTSPYQVSWDTTAVADGGYTLTAKAYDAAGNAGTSASIAVTVGNADTVAPQVALTSPGNGTTVSGGVAVAASASDNVGVTKVEFYAGTALIGASTSSPYQVSWDTTAVATGSYTLTAKAYDAAGNATSSSAVTVTVADKTPPLTAITCGGSSCQAGFYTTPVQVALVATDSQSGVAQIRYTTDGSTPTATFGTPYLAPFTMNETRTLKFVSVDKAGNVSPVKSQLLQIDVMPPTISFAAPTNGATITGTVTVKANATDASKGSGMASVTFYLDGTLQTTVTGAGPGYVWSWNTRKATKGSHTLSAVATDGVGNTTSTQITVTVA